MGKVRPILSIGMLASDRLDTLPRCLESLVPIREAFPCEIIVVDTSKNPQIGEVIRKYADKTDTFEWCNDFAKARNACLNLAEGEWFMFIDDDEWFAEPEGLIEFFRSGEYQEYSYAHHRIKNYHDPEFKTYSYGWVTRLTKIFPDTAFHSKVHEYFAPFNGKSKNLHATSYHTGYMFKTKEDQMMHFRRNMQLLQNMEKEEPEELRWKVQILQEYCSVADWDNMEDYGKKTLGYLWGSPRTVEASQFAIIHIAYAIALLHQKHYEEVLRVAEQVADVIGDAVVANAYMKLCKGEGYWGLGKYGDARTCIEEYFENYKVYSMNPEEYNEEGLRIFLCNTFTEVQIAKAYSIRLSSQLRSGYEEEIYDIYPKLQWDNAMVRVYCDLEVELIDYLVRKPDYKMLERALKDAFDNPLIRPNMMKGILDWRQKDATRFLELLGVIGTLDIQNWYKEYALLLTLPQDATGEEVKEAAERFIRLTPDIFVIPAEVIDVLKEHNIDSVDLYKSLEFKQWKDKLNDYLEHNTMEQVGKLQQQLAESSLVDDVRYHYLMMIYMEQKALLGRGEKLSFDQLTELLASFSDYTCLCYEQMGGDQLQTMPVESWPKKYQAAKWLQVFYSEIENDLKSALGCLAKVIVVYPRMADIMQYYLERIQEEILNG